MFGLNRLVTVVYLIIGVILAADRGYLEDLDRIKRLLSAALAVVLWPLLLLGISLRID